MLQMSTKNTSYQNKKINLSLTFDTAMLCFPYCYSSYMPGRVATEGNSQDSICRLLLSYRYDADVR